MARSHRARVLEMMKTLLNEDAEDLTISVQSLTQRGELVTKAEELLAAGPGNDVEFGSVVHQYWVIVAESIMVNAS